MRLFLLVALLAHCARNGGGQWLLAWRCWVWVCLSALVEFVYFGGGSSGLSVFLGTECGLFCKPFSLSHSLPPFRFFQRLDCVAGRACVMCNCGFLGALGLRPSKDGGGGGGVVGLSFLLLFLVLPRASLAPFSDRLDCGLWLQVPSASLFRCLFCFVSLSFFLFSRCSAVLVRVGVWGLVMCMGERWLKCVRKKGEGEGRGELTRHSPNPRPTQYGC